MKRVFDPLHRFIELDDREVRLLDTSPVQRLRRLRQLGFASLAFPGAEHTRFSHALGALAAGTRAFDGLRENDPAYFADEADFQRQRRLLRASLLLHDVGHGPFSHASEHALGKRHEDRTRAILELAEMRDALAAIGVDHRDVLQLIAGEGPGSHPVLKELVSGPNLDADRMDYLVRDSYFTGVTNGRYDAEQLMVSFRVFERGGKPALGIDGRGIVALESFVIARYMMFAAVYFHHTTRMFEHMLTAALTEIWPDPRALDDVAEFLSWDDFRLLDALRTARSPAAQALRERRVVYGVAAEFNAARDLRPFGRCHGALRERFGDAVWADSQEQLLHRLPLGTDEAEPTILVSTRTGIVDAREASDLIARLSGKAYWRKLFVAKDAVSTSEAREICKRLLESEG